MVNEDINLNENDEEIIMGLKKPKPAEEVEAKAVVETENPAPTEDEPKAEAAGAASREEAAKKAEAAGAASNKEAAGDPDPKAGDPDPSKELAEKPKTEVAATNTQKQMAASKNFAQDAADDGFEGLEVGFGSFPMITLPGEAVFILSEGEVELGKSIKVRIQNSREKLVFSVKDDDDIKPIYSYDGVTVAGSADLVADQTAQWKAEGEDVVTKKYLECTALIDSCDVEEHNGIMVLLSLPPTAVNKFSGYVAQLRFAGLSPRDVVTECYVGAKVTGAKKPFYPWAFRKIT